MASVGFNLVRMRAPIIRPLTSVAVIMCYLAAVALAAAIGVGRWVNAWQDQANLKMSLYIPAIEDVSEIQFRTKKIQQIIRLMEGEPAIADVRLISKKEMAALLIPWLGQNIDLTNMPLIDLVDITLKSNRSLDEVALRVAIKNILPDAVLENHQQWHNAIGRWVLFIQILSGLILLAALGCMTAVISLAAHATIDANRTSIHVLYLIGAEDGFICRAFRRYFLRLGLTTGILGAAAAALTFFLTKQFWQFVPESLNLSAIGLTLLPIDYAALAIIPALTCLIAVAASRRQAMLYLRELP